MYSKAVCKQTTELCASKQQSYVQADSRAMCKQTAASNTKMTWSISWQCNHPLSTVFPVLLLLLTVIAAYLHLQAAKLCKRC
jgi:hypothetical protein